MTENNNEDKMQVNVHVPADLDYLYRDIANVYVGTSDVVIEFGNFHRAAPGNASISNRIVLSMANAYQLQESLSSALAQAQQMMRQQLEKDK